jgi:hypothetical protein
MNHIGARYVKYLANCSWRTSELSRRFPAPHERDRDETKRNVIAEIERQATEAWGGGNAVAAHDFLTVTIPAAPKVDSGETTRQYGQASRNGGRHDHRDQEEVGVREHSVSGGYDAVYRRQESGSQTRGSREHWRGRGSGRGRADQRSRKRYRSDDKA